MTSKENVQNRESDKTLALTLATLRTGEHLELDSDLGFPSACYSHNDKIIHSEGYKPENGLFWNFVSYEEITSLEGMLKDSGFDYTCDVEIRLCCDKTSKKTKSLFLPISEDQKVLLIAPPPGMFTVTAIAYIPNLIKEDERIERALIQYLIEHEAGTLKFYNSAGEAKARKEEVISSLLSSYVRCCGYRGVVLWSGGIKHTFPKDLQYSRAELNKRGGVAYLSESLEYIPRILKEYPDLTVLVSEDGNSCSPLEEYLDTRKGIMYFSRVPACYECYPSLESKLKEQVCQNITLEKSFALTSELAKKIGYNFNFDRITIKIRNKKFVDI